jgi:uncharacterized protein involved in exopolysaccharide biosynthesis
LDIKTILERGKDYLNRVKKRWPLILLLCVLFGAIFLYNSLLKPTFYKATTTFHPETSGKDSEGFSPISLLFGDGTGKSSNSFMMGVLKSRFISEAVTSDTVEYAGEKHLLADLILDQMPPYISLISQVQYWIKGWKRPEEFYKKVLVSADYIRKSLSLESTDEGFILLGISAYDQQLAGLISEEYTKQLREYYSERKTIKASRNVDFFSKRADSIRIELNNVNRRIAAYEDRNRYNLYQQDGLIPAELTSQQAILSQIYATLVISREQAMAQLQEDTPVIQVLDPPKPPYKKISSNWILHILIGIFLGVFLGIFFAIYPLAKEDIIELIKKSLKLPPYDEEEEQAQEDYSLES